MPIYIYRARDWQGRTHKGFHHAEGLHEAINYLRRRKLVIIDIRERSSMIPVTGSWTKGLSWRRIGPRDYMLFCRHFATMISAGLTVVRSLQILRDGEGNGTLKRTIGALVPHIESGSTLAGAMGDYPEVFPTMMVKTIAAAEAGGILGEVLERLAVHYEKQSSLEEKVRGAMIYPLVVAFVALLVMATMFLYILPAFGSMFSNMNIELPLITRAVMGVGDFLGYHRYPILALVVAVALSFLVSLKTERGKELAAFLKLKTPIFAPNYKRMIWARFARTMSSLLGSGMNIITALEMGKEIIGNRIHGRALERVGRDIAAGCTLAESLERSGLFPAMMVEMVRIGEETGNLEEMLAHAADLLERELIYTMDRLTTTIEPAIIVFVGFFVGLMVFAIILPLFSIYEGI